MTQGRRQSNSSKVYEPSSKEIEQAKLKIQEGWSEDRRRLREHGTRIVEPYTVPIVSIQQTRLGVVVFEDVG